MLLWEKGKLYLADKTKMTTFNENGLAVSEETELVCVFISEP